MHRNAEKFLLVLCQLPYFLHAHSRVVLRAKHDDATSHHAGTIRVLLDQRIRLQQLFEQNIVNLGT